MEVTRLAADDIPAHTIHWINRNSLLGSIPFARLWEQMDGRPTYWAATEGDQIACILPGVEFGRALLTRYQAMPDGLYARFMYPGGTPHTNAGPNDLLKAISEAGYQKAFVNDFYGLTAPTDSQNAKGRTILVDLAVPSWEPSDAKIRSEIRKAEREGVTYVEFSLNRHFDNFIELMRSTEKRHDRKPKYPPPFWRELARLAMVDSRLKWLVCEHEGEIAASHIYLVEGDQLFYWQAYFDKRFASLKANQFMTYTLAKELSIRGVSTLNMGASPPQSDSLSDYKLKWGGDVVEYPVVEYRSLLGRIF